MTPQPSQHLACRVVLRPAHSRPVPASLCVQLGLLNVADYNFVQRAVEAVHATLQAALRDNAPLPIRLGLRILAALVSPRPLRPSVLLQAPLPAALAALPLPVLACAPTLTLLMGCAVWQAGTLVVSPAALLRVFQALVTDAVAALDGAPAWQARGDWYVYAVLGALPWGGKELALVSQPRNRPTLAQPWRCCSSVCSCRHWEYYWLVAVAVG